MSDTTQISLCILWEDELRQAARLLQAAFDAPKDDECRADLFRDAMLAAHVALKGLTDDKVVCMIAQDTIRKASEEGK